MDTVHIADRSRNLLLCLGPEDFANLAKVWRVSLRPGTSMHHFASDKKGLISKVNLIVGTTHNLGPINMSVNQAARTLIKKGKIDEDILSIKWRWRYAPMTPEFPAPLIAWMAIPLFHFKSWMPKGK
jgi:hypothetical protein